MTIPVRLYAATKSHDVNFHLIRKKDSARLRTVRWCPIDDRAVPWEEVERGYEVAKDSYVPVTELLLMEALRASVEASQKASWGRPGLRPPRQPGERPRDGARPPNGGSTPRPTAVSARGISALPGLSMGISG